MSRLERSTPDGSSFEHKESLMVRAENIPQILKPCSQWVCWRYATREEGKKPDKRPINPHTLGNAGPYWRNSWSTFPTAYATYLRHQGLNTSSHLDGVGFFLTADDPYVAVDMDFSITPDGITDHAQEVIKGLESYSEVSPSGQGIRIMVASPTPIGNFKSKELEMYSHARYVTLTGNHVAGTPLEITKVDPNLLQSLRPPQVPATIPKPHESKPYTGSDDQLWEQIFRYDKLGAAHLRRFQGDLSLDHGDHSLAVIRLLNALARWSGGDAARMRSMMLMSPLANEKWLSKRGTGDYLDYQVENAIKFVLGKK
jgi:putative DNA primase/helicase